MDAKRWKISPDPPSAADCKLISWHWQLRISSCSWKTYESIILHKCQRAVRRLAHPHHHRPAHPRRHHPTCHRRHHLLCPYHRHRPLRPAAETQTMMPWSWTPMGTTPLETTLERTHRATSGRVTRLAREISAQVTMARALAISHRGRGPRLQPRRPRHRSHHRHRPLYRRRHRRTSLFLFPSTTCRVDRCRGSLTAAQEGMRFR